MSPDAPILTERFSLRLLTPEDATARYSDWLGDPEFGGVIESAGKPHAVENIRAFIAQRCGRQDVLFLGIFTRQGEHIGNIKFEPVDSKRGFAVMGILIGEKGWRGRGAAGEVLRATADWLARNRGIRKLILGVNRGHRAAIRAYEKVGFRCETTPEWPLKDPLIHQRMVWHLAPTRRTLAARAYNEFDGYLRCIEAGTAQSAPSLLGYCGQAVGRRLVQRVAELGLASFVAQKSRGAALDELIDCDGLLIDRFAGKLTLSAKRWLSACAQFLAHWCHALGRYAAGFPQSVVEGPAALVYGLWPQALSYQGSDERFAEFCDSGLLAPLARAGRLLIETALRPRRSRPGKLFYADHALSALHAQGGGKTFSEALAFLADHGRAAAAFLRAATTTPALAILGKDFAYHALAASLQRRGLIEAVVYSYGEYHQQPLWMTDLPGRSFATGLFWYSTNIKHIVYQDEPVHAVTPNNRLIRADDVWVWSQRQKEDLLALGLEARFHVQGPILGYLPERTRPQPRRRLAIFDVTPLDLRRAAALGIPDNYYSPRTAIAFIEDILESCRLVKEKTGAAVEAVLKPKRGYNIHHDRGYIDFIERRKSEGALMIEETDVNLFSFVAQSALCVVAPFSSPAYIASSVGVPAAFYDPTGRIKEEFDPAPGVEFLSGRQALSDLIARRFVMMAPS